MWIDTTPSHSWLSRSYTVAKSPGDGADVVGSRSDCRSRSKNWPVVRSTRSRNDSVPNSTRSGTTSMPRRSHHSAGTSAVESVTTRKPATPLLHREDEGVVLLAPGLDLHLEVREVAADG